MDRQVSFYKDATGLSNASLSDMEWIYYSTRSGLTPVGFYTLTDHKRKYWQNQTGLVGVSMAQLERAFYNLNGISAGSLNESAYAFYNTVVLTNYVPNPGAEGVTSSLINSSNTSISLSNFTATGWPVSGSKSYSVITPSTAIFSFVVPVTPLVAVPGDRWTGKCVCYLGQGALSSRVVQIRLRFANSSNVAILNVTSGSDLIAPGEIKEYIISGVAPATTAFLTFVVFSNTVFDANDVIYVDNVLLTKNNYTGPYFDGDTPGASWLGTPHSSISTKPVSRSLVA